MSASLNDYLSGTKSLGESNNPSAPQIWGLFPPINKGGLTLTQLWGLLPRLTLTNLGMNSLGESNNPRAPQLRGL